MEKDKQIAPWLRLRGTIADEVFMSPKIGFDPKGRRTVTNVSRKAIGYIERNMADTLWKNHLSLAALIMSAQHLDDSTVVHYLQILNITFKKLFKNLRLKTMSQWNADIYIPAYLRSELVQKDSLYARFRFLHAYNSVTRRVNKWLRSLPIDDRQLYQQYTMPIVNPLLTGGIINSDDVYAKQRQHRKDEASAIIPLFPRLRAEAHFRHSRMVRLHQAYQDALKEMSNGGHELPFTFSYDEGGDIEKGIPAQERLHFRIWDRPSLVLTHQNNYSRHTVRFAKEKLFHFATQHFYLEFFSVERLTDAAPPEGLWFADLLRMGVVGSGLQVNMVEEKQKWLRSHGYGGSDPKKIVEPFNGGPPGVLNWAVSDARFLRKAQTFVQGVLIPIEPFYIASLFGLLATDIFTTTGARMNEAMQIRLDGDGFVRMEMPAPAGARDQSPRIRYVLRMIPKGERADKPANYFIGRETERLIEKTVRLLVEHYKLDVDKGQILPVVKFTPSHTRSHRFAPARYLFQYNHTHFSSEGIHSCMRFLLHGMAFLTSDKTPVIIKSHLLRHAFATHAVHVEKVPIDIVREILHQRNIYVTEYYTKPTDTIVAEGADMLLSRLASHVSVREILLRSPVELEQQYNEAVKAIGPLCDAPGGHCTCRESCIGHRLCIGCPHKVPDPAKRDQIISRKHFAEQRLEEYVTEGLIMDAEQMRQTIRDCETELKEMDMMEKYRRDETRVALIQIESRRRD
jgi:hypothetical protein